MREGEAEKKIVLIFFRPSAHSLSPALPRSADSTGASRSDDDRVCDIFQHKNEHLHRVIKMKALLLTNNAIVSFPLSPTLYLSVYFFFIHGGVSGSN